MMEMGLGEENSVMCEGEGGRRRVEKKDSQSTIVNRR